MLNNVNFLSCICQNDMVNIKNDYYKICSALGIKATNNEAYTCCGRTYYERGELKLSKEIAEKFIQDSIPNSNLFFSNAKCFRMVNQFYKTIFHNTIIHNQAYNVANNSLLIYDFLVEKNIMSFYQTKINQKAFLLIDCNVTKSTVDKLILPIHHLDFTEPEQRFICCGVAGNVVIENEQVAEKMALNIINEYEQSDCDYILFTDETCILFINYIAEKHKKHLKTKHLITLIAETIN